MKPSFGPVPSRAARDSSLTALEWRLLAAIAAHDCFGARGRGCTAGHKRIASIVGAAQKSVARSITRLVAKGYIAGEPVEDDGRHRDYRIIYTLEDNSLFARGDSSRTIETENTSALIADRQFSDPSCNQQSKVSDSVSGSAGSVTIGAAIGNREQPVSNCYYSDSRVLREDSEENKDKRTLNKDDRVCDSPILYHSPHQLCSASNHSPAIPAVEEPDDLSKVLKAWADFKKTPTKLTWTERKKLQHSIKCNGVKRLTALIRQAQASPFLRGDQGNWNGMPLKWLWNQQRLQEIEREEFNGKPASRNGRHATGKMESIRELLDKSQNVDHSG